MTGRAANAVTAERLRGQVRDRYGKIASGGGCCAPSPGSGSCCGGSSCGDTAATVQLGYASGELDGLPVGANLGLGCGNPTALVSLRPGEVVLDLGSGAGIDCFLAAKKVGPKGRVIGVDMTPEMLAKARANAVAGRYRNVEFRLGEIEHLPVADRSVNVVISNCVVNLAPDKGAVYREAFRVLKPGGRLAVADVVATRPISPGERADASLWSSCSSGALEVGRVKTLLRRAGFARVTVDLDPRGGTPETLRDQAARGVVPADIVAVKPGG
jgi:arsenite methyltransferase